MSIESFAGTVTGTAPHVVGGDLFVGGDGTWAVVAGDLADAREMARLYTEYGEDCVHLPYGAFAFVVGDGQRVLLARDRFGQCPLYYSVAGRRLSFASTLRGLLGLPGVPAELDRTALADLSVVGRLCGARTALRGIEALPAGHVLTWDYRGGVVSRRYYQPPASPISMSLRDAEDQLLDILGQAVRDASPEAVLLSGGLDSAVLAALLAESGPVPAFVVAERPDHPDAVQAARIARHFGFPIERLLVGFPDFLAAIPRYLATAGHPTGLGSVGTRLLCESMGTGVAAVTGEGADDVFGGYGDYLQSMKDRRETIRRAELVAEHGFELSAEAADLLRRTTVNHTFPTYLAAVHTGQELGPYTQRDAQLTHLTGAATGTRLRLPYLDHRLVQLALALPVEYRVDHQVGIDKRVLRTAVLRHFAGHDVLVDSVLRRKFGGPSAVRGHKERFAMVCERYLPPDYRDGHPLGPLVQHTHELVLLELFEEIFVTRRGVLPTGFDLAEFLRERSRGLHPVPS